MPIIKKWLYSDKDIFIREIISNGSDAIVKRQLAQPEFLGQGEIHVQVDEAAGVLRFIDNGVGMTADEVRRYINQVAFSSAEEFLKQYEGADKGGIIGHFGLGFYSVFMVSKLVEIDTLSWQDGAEPARWTSEDGLSFEMGEGSRDAVGTTITLTIQDEEHEFLHTHRVREVLERYCAFMAIPIYLEDMSKKDEPKPAEPSDSDESIEDMDDTSDTDEERLTAEEEEELAKEAAKLEGLSEEEMEKELERITSEMEAKEAAHKHDHDHDHDHDHHDHDHARDEKPKPPAAPKPINDTHPLWLKDPKEADEKEYKDFYYKVFHEYEAPLFWVHLNVDYPFRLKGILYFPKLKQEFAGIQEGPIKLFSGQVFVADNIKEVIPEFLTLLKGVIDCPDLPLNVSRSFLQNDGYVKKLSAYITRKVADRLNSLFSGDRPNYEKYWEDIHPFIKYGCMKDEAFFDKVKDILIYKTTDGAFQTRAEYLEANKDKAENKVFYATDEHLQATTIALYKDQGIGVALLDSPIDVNFISFMEYKDQQVKYARVDADLSGLESKEAGLSVDLKRLEAMFRDALDRKDLTVTLEALKDETIPAVVLEEEQTRRFRDMSRFMGRDMGMGMAPSVKLALNSRSPVVEALSRRDAGEETSELCRQIYDLAEMARQPLEPDAAKRFISRSYALLARLIKAG
jgi:molecular chaperone HtpG